MLWSPALLMVLRWREGRVVRREGPTVCIILHLEEPLLYNGM